MSRICIYSTIESATNIFPELRSSRLLQSLMATSGTHVFLYIQESLKRAHLYVQLAFTFILRIQTRAVRLYILEFGSRESEQGFD